MTVNHETKIVSEQSTTTSDVGDTIISLTASEGFKIAVEEARQGFEEGGIPIGACLVGASGEILGRGRNLRIQKDSATLHGEIAAFENAGRLHASIYKGATCFTTLSPCNMCTGLCILYGVKRVVIGENKTFLGGEDLLKDRGIEVVVLDNDECEDLMKRFIKKNPDDWNEDIGVD